MTDARRAPHLRVLPPALMLAAWLAASADFEGRGSAAGQRIDWDHPTLELSLASVSDLSDRARLELCVRTHPGVDEGSTSVGFPRYRTAWGRWVDGVIQGVGRNHVLHASAAEGPACFSVVVAHGATTLDLPIGGQALEIEIGAWLEALRAGAEPTLPVEDRWDRAVAAPSEAETVFPDPLHESAPPTPALPLVPDVDRVIPTSPWLRPTGLAVVLGVEAYASAPPATYAAADARTAARYFEQVLGIPAERTELLVDGEVTLGQFQRLFGEDGWLARRIAPDSEVFVFFAGHGMAELTDFAPYLLPADADPNYVRQTAFSVDRMVESLAALRARRTTLFLDACFGALSREGTALLDRARPLVLVPVQPAFGAGVSVFSAGTGSQIASSLDDQGHGLFSYHLFRGLGGEADLDLDRRIDAGELKRYLEDAVPRAAQALDREQFPAIALDDPEQLLVQLP